MSTRATWVKIGLVIGLLFGTGLSVGYSLTNTGQVDGPVPIVASDGPNATFIGSSNQVNLRNPFPDANTVELSTDAGNVTFVSKGPTNLTIRPGNITGPWTNVTELDVSQNPLYINPDDKEAANVSGNPDEFGFVKTVQADDGKTDFYFSGASGSTTITLRGVNPGQTYSAVDQNGATLDVSTSKQDGSVRFEGMSNSNHIVTVQSGSTNTPPQLSNPVPSGNVSTYPTQLEIDVEDGDFPTGDSVTLEFYWDGSLRDTQTVSSNGTYSTSNLPTITGGNHNYTVYAEDSIGDADYLETTVGIPGTLYIRNETDASELVDFPVNVTIRWNRDDTDIVLINTTTTGTVNMTGLPVTDFIVEVDPSQDYINRTAYIPTTIGQDSVYTLNKSFARVESRFVLDDRSGEFSSNSILFIKRAIRLNGTTKYRTVHSDKFGAEGVPAGLEKDVRFRISVRSEDGVTRDIGPYRATQSEVVNVNPGAPTIDTWEQQGGYQYAVESNEDKLFVHYNDTEALTESVKIYIHEYRNKSNQFRPNATYFDQQKIDSQYTFQGSENETEWVVNFIIERDGKTVTSSATTFNRPTLFSLPGNWGLVVGLLVMLIFSGIFSVLNKSIGAVMIPVVGGMMFWLGFLDGAATGASIVIALGVGIIYSVYSSGGP